MFLGISILLAVGFYSAILILGYSVLKTNPHDLSHRLFFLFCLSFVAWLTANFLQIWIPNPEAAILLTKIDFILAPFFGLYLFLFLLSFPIRQRFLNTWTIVGAHLLALSASYAVIANTVIVNIAKEGHKILFEEASLFPFYAVVIIFFMIGGTIFNLFNFARLKGYKKKQAKIIAIGFAATFIILVTGNLFLQNFLDPEWFILVNFSSVLLPASLTLAVLYHRFMGLSSIFDRGFFFWAMFMLIVLCLILAKEFTTFFTQYTDTGDFSAIVLFSAMFTPFLIYTFQAIEKVSEEFFSSRVSMKKVLNNVLHEITQAKDLEHYVDILKDRIELIFGVDPLILVRTNHNQELTIYGDQSVFTSDFSSEDFLYKIRRYREPVLVNDVRYRSIVPEGEQQQTTLLLQQHRIAVVAPVMETEHDHQLAVIVLKKKPNGENYSQEEISFLQMLIPQLPPTITKYTM